jgi:hypothetical protein
MDSNWAMSLKTFRITISERISYSFPSERVVDSGIERIRSSTSQKRTKLNGV